MRWYEIFLVEFILFAVICWFFYLKQVPNVV